MFLVLRPFVCHWSWVFVRNMWKNRMITIFKRCWSYVCRALFRTVLSQGIGVRRTEQAVKLLFSQSYHGARSSGSAQCVLFWRRVCGTAPTLSKQRTDWHSRRHTMPFAHLARCFHRSTNALNADFSRKQTHTNLYQVKETTERQ